MGPAEQGWPGGGSTPIVRGTRASGRWLLFKPRLLFCSSPLCAWRGFCCSLKRLNSCCICRRGEWGEEMLSRCPGEGVVVGWGVLSIPRWAWTPLGAVGRGPGSTRAWSVVQPTGAVGLLVQQLPLPSPHFHPLPLCKITPRSRDKAACSNICLCQCAGCFCWGF